MKIPATHKLTPLETKMLETIQLLLRVRYMLRLDKAKR